MKKTFTLFVLVVLFSGLGWGSPACSQEEVTTTTASTAPTTTTTTVPATTTTTAAPATTTTSTAPPQEPISLKFATTFLETEAGGVVVQRFCDYVEEKTAGAVVFDVYFAGSLGAEAEELGMVGAGSVDLILLRSDLVPDQVPLLSFPMRVPVNGRGATAYFDHLVFNDPDTAALIEAEAAVNNVVYLASNARGTSVFVATEPFTGLADLAGRQLGADRLSAAFEALGCTVVDISPTDIYEALATKAVGAAYGGLAGVLQSRWHEIAKHFMFDGTYGVGDAFTVNRDTWAELTPETQGVFRDAAYKMADLSFELEAADRAKAVKTLEAAGVTVGTLNPEDQNVWFRSLFEAEAAECMERAERLGIGGDMKLVLSRAAQYLGVDWPR